MLSKKVLKDIQSLGLKKHRTESGLFLAEGPKIVAELLQLIPQQVEGVYATKEWCEEFPESRAELISDIELERISQLHTPHQVVAIVKQFEQIQPQVKNEWCLYLDAIQDPGNFGTMIRTADWFGIKQIVCSSGCAELYNPKVIQATMASIARVNVWYDENADWLQNQAAPIFAATLSGSSIYDHQKKGSGILVIGNESKGISRGLLALAKNQITIPKIGGAESLNAAVATGIILSHLVKS